VRAAANDGVGPLLLNRSEQVLGDKGEHFDSRFPIEDERGVWAKKRLM